MLHQKEDTGTINSTQRIVLLNLEDDMKCQKFYILFIVLFGLFSSFQLHATSPSFTSIYTTLDRLEVQVKELKMNLIMQQTLSLQLQEQLKTSQQLTSKLQEQLSSSVEQLQTAQKDAEILNRQLQNLEKKYKIWRNVSIAATITTVATTAILILIRK